VQHLCLYNAVYVDIGPPYLKGAEGREGAH